MGLSSNRRGTAQMVLGDQFPNSNDGSSVPPDGPWLLAINGGHVETGSDEHGWQKLGLLRSGGLEALRYLSEEGGNAHLAVQVTQPFLVMSLIHPHWARVMPCPSPLRAAVHTGLPDDVFPEPIDVEQVVG